CPRVMVSSIGRSYVDSSNGGIGICRLGPLKLRTPVADTLPRFGDSKLYPAANAPALTPPIKNLRLFIVDYRLKSSLCA
ncbi:hypothetical protein N9R29_02165, partial [Gammaproteobacteria bacterium]|nr:hypothetical protein [Gammaproteobacteria bacterium]